LYGSIVPTPHPPLNADSLNLPPGSPNAKDWDAEKRASRRFASKPVSCGCRGARTRRAPRRMPGLSCATPRACRLVHSASSSDRRYWASTFVLWIADKPQLRALRHAMESRMQAGFYALPIATAVSAAHQDAGVRLSHHECASHSRDPTRSDWTKRRPSRAEDQPGLSAAGRGDSCLPGHRKSGLLARIRLDLFSASPIGLVRRNRLEHQFSVGSQRPGTVETARPSTFPRAANSVSLTISAHGLLLFKLATDARRPPVATQIGRSMTAGSGCCVRRLDQAWFGTGWCRAHGQSPRKPGSIRRPTTPLPRYMRPNVVCGQGGADRARAPRRSLAVAGGRSLNLLVALRRVSRPAASAIGYLYMPLGLAWGRYAT